jgi:tRNA pseudouridine38-40 synthase
MNKACEILKATTNFESFSKVHTDVATFECTVTEAKWEKKSENELLFTITANRFLRNMVRSIVGTMINIGLEKVSLLQFIEILESNDRRKAGFSAPAHGLYLTKVNYSFLN